MGTSATFPASLYVTDDTILNNTLTRSEWQQVAVEVEAIEAALGVDPAGTSDTVVARFATLPTAAGATAFSALSGALSATQHGALTATSQTHPFSAITGVWSATQQATLGTAYLSSASTYWAAGMQTVSDPIVNLRVYGITSTALTDAIAALPAAGGTVLIPQGLTVTLNTSVTLTKPLTIRGEGENSILQGTASPLLISDSPNTNTISLRDLRIVTASANTGVKIAKSFPGGSRPIFDIDNVSFHASGSGGVLLDLDIVVGGHVSHCTFTSNNGTAGTTVGARCLATATQGTQSVYFLDNHFWNLDVCMQGIGLASASIYMAGIEVAKSKMLLANKGIDWRHGDYFVCEGNIIDQVYRPVVIDSDKVRILGNYIGVASGENNHAVVFQATSTDNFVQDYLVQGNMIVGLNPTGQDGVKVDASVYLLQFGQIAYNNISNFKNGVNVTGTGGNNHIFISNNLFTLCTAAGVNLDTGASFCHLTGNYFDASVTSHLVDVGTSNRHLSYIDSGTPNQNGGVSTQNGDGVTVAFNIAHGLPAAPRFANVTPGASGSTNSAFFITYGATNIVVTFGTAPTSGTGNVVLRWYAECN